MNKEYYFEIINKIISYCSYYTFVSLNFANIKLTKFNDSKIVRNEIVIQTLANITIYNKNKKIQIQTNDFTGATRCNVKSIA